MLPTIINGMIDDGCDILVPIATPTAQAAAAATSDVTIVFSAVSNPVEAGLVESLIRQIRILQAYPILSQSRISLNWQQN